MATSGIVCLKFILQNTFSPRFIPIICQQSSSKSKDIRRHICEFLDIMLHTWQTYTLEKHVNLLQDAIKKGIADPDPDARTFARRAYWGFAEHFKDQADTLMSGLDPTYKRALQGEMSQSSSSNSLNVLQGQGAPRITTGVNRSRQASVTGSSENLIDDHKVNCIVHNNSLRDISTQLFTIPCIKLGLDGRGAVSIVIVQGCITQPD